ncbi:hypothetical protein D3C72_1292150 [compost metagenome]
MVGGGRRSQRRNRVVDVVLSQRDHVHIAFDHQQTPGFSVILLGFIKAIQLATFVENIGFRGVKVFRHAVTQHAPTKTNHPASLIADGEHHPFAEAVVASALIVCHQHTGINQRLTIFAIATKTL